MSDFADSAVEAAFAAFPQPHQRRLLDIRALILDEARAIDLPGGVEESLKWGEPSYAPVKPRTGSAIRLGSFDEQHVALYFNCQSMLVENLRATYGDELAYSKNRAVLFKADEPMPAEVVRHCARSALRYHLDKKRR